MKTKEVIARLGKVVGGSDEAAEAKDDLMGALQDIINSLNTNKRTEFEGLRRDLATAINEYNEELGDKEVPKLYRLFDQQLGKARDIAKKMLQRIEG